MLWYKSWLETRWRFVAGAALVTLSTAGVVFTFPQVQKLMPLVPAIDVSGEIGRRIREAAELSREYRGFVWLQGYRQNLAQMVTLFAVLLGTGGLLSQGSTGALFTLSLPVSRRQLIGIRAAAGLSELLALALIPSLVFPVLSPAVGERYALAAGLVHGVCLFAAAAVFFSLTFLLSTVFGDLWRPLLIALAIACGIGICEQVFHTVSRYGLFGLMSGEIYFRTGALPWPGLIVAALASTAMLYAASTNIAQHDF